MMSFAEIYRSILFNTLDHGEEELNARTGSKILANPTGASFCLDLTDGRVPTCGLRRTYPHVAAAELVWCLRGDNHINWLRRHTKAWDAFADANKCLTCAGERVYMDQVCPQCIGSGEDYRLNEAYGWRWRYEFNVDQLELGLNRLRQDQTDRRVWISSWDPAHDIQNFKQKTVPCPVGFTLSILNGKLNSSLIIRSSDLYHGLPHDVARHALFVCAAALSTNVMPGYMRITLAHPHIYEAQWQLCREMIRQPTIAPPLAAPAWSCQEILESQDEYVAIVKHDASQFVWPAFNPKSEVVK